MDYITKSFPKCEMITAGKGINKFFSEKNQLKNYLLLNLKKYLLNLNNKL